MPESQQDDPRLCICDDGTPVWCDRHGDIWYSDDGDQHHGPTPPEVAEPRVAEGSELGGCYPLSWEFPPLGIQMSYRRDDGALVTRGIGWEAVRRA